MSESEKRMIAVDALGGDFAPTEVIKGALQAARKGVPIILFGPHARVEQELMSLDAAWKAHAISIVDSPEEIAMGEHPVKAVRAKINSSLVKAVASCSAGQTKAVVSAGNSGALMAAATFILGRQEGVERPAIAGWLPSKKGKVFALDLGATVDCKPSYLFQFAQLGVSYLHSVSGIDQPRVALLSNGEERSKGSQVGREAFSLLEQSSLNFIGNIEPAALIEHKADVVVTDGFAGNILLKTMEATAVMLGELFSSTVQENQEIAPQVKQQVIQAISLEAKALLTGRALLLGVNGTVIVLHGNAKADAVEHGIHMAWRSVGSKKR